MEAANQEIRTIRSKQQHSVPAFPPLALLESRVQEPRRILDAHFSHDKPANFAPATLLHALLFIATLLAVKI
ncbi:hypothetical protein CBOM_07779 [Ceraceosorus bombacis]|uniref:Uncharacterized protein n=1 Tax=Ceraceosorus bombacis TaxID=401625 RepID=A0A0P1BLR8_9BASI|nr:hypothetical protein CBOM_07779 [Ceraceosorus bombacis]